MFQNLIRNFIRPDRFSTLCAIYYVFNFAAGDRIIQRNILRMDQAYCLQVTTCAEVFLDKTVDQNDLPYFRDCIKMKNLQTIFQIRCLGLVSNCRCHHTFPWVCHVCVLARGTEGGPRILAECPYRQFLCLLIDCVYMLFRHSVRPYQMRFAPL